jgi:hypothetical protein
VNVQGAEILQKSHTQVGMAAARETFPEAAVYDLPKNKIEISRTQDKSRCPSGAGSMTA